MAFSTHWTTDPEISSDEFFQFFFFTQDQTHFGENIWAERQGVNYQSDAKFSKCPNRFLLLECISENTQ